MKQKQSSAVQRNNHLKPIIISNQSSKARLGVQRVIVIAHSRRDAARLSVRTLAPGLRHAASGRTSRERSDITAVSTTVAVAASSVKARPRLARAAEAVERAGSRATITTLNQSIRALPDPTRSFEDNTNSNLYGPRPLEKSALEGSRCLKKFPAAVMGTSTCACHAAAQRRTRPQPRIPHQPGATNPWTGARPPAEIGSRGRPPGSPAALVHASGSPCSTQARRKLGEAARFNRCTDRKIHSEIQI